MEKPLDVRITYKKMHHLRKIEKVKDHGRIEKGRYSIISCKDKNIFTARWPGMRSIGMLEVKRGLYLIY